MIGVTIGLETPDQPDVRLLLHQADDRSSSLYPEESRHGLGIAALLLLQATFFVARVDQRAVGCGGFVRGEPGQAELKRMFVTDTARGRGVGRALLCAAENAAVQQDIRLMQLETGVKSSEAIGLYRGAGYRERGPFGQYRPDPLSVFMEKVLIPSTRRSEAALGRHPRAVQCCRVGCTESAPPHMRGEVRRLTARGVPEPANV